MSLVQAEVLYVIDVCTYMYLVCLYVPKYMYSMYVYIMYVCTYVCMYIMYVRMRVSLG